MQTVPKVGAPIATNVVTEIADEHDVETDTVRKILDTAQEGMESYLTEYREDTVAAETEDILITYSPRGYTEEKKQVISKINEDLDDHLEDSIYDILLHAHFAAFESSRITYLTKFGRDDLAAITGSAFPRIIRKPEDSKPTTEDLDLSLYIHYDKGGVSPYSFVTQAQATVTGQYGTLEINRTYKALPDSRSNRPRDEILVSSEATHVDSDTLVIDDTESWSHEKELPESNTPIDRFDYRLRYWTYRNHITNIDSEYHNLHDLIPLCQDCGTYTDHNAGIYVTQRSSNEFDSSTPDVVCNRCYAEFLADSTMLSQQEAEVYALKDAGLSYSQIATAHGEISRSQVGTVMGRVKKKRKQAEEDLKTVKRTSELITIDD